jgi:hypothetical protein
MDERWGLTLMTKVELVVHGDDVPAVTELFGEVGARGFTAVPNVSGLGHSGLHQGRLLFNERSALTYLTVVLSPERAAVLAGGVALLPAVLGDSQLFRQGQPQEVERPDPPPDLRVLEPDGQWTRESLPQGGQVRLARALQVLPRQPTELALQLIIPVGAGGHPVGAAQHWLDPVHDLQQHLPLLRLELKERQIALAADLRQAQSRARVAWRPWA